MSSMQVSYMIVGQAENDIELSNEPDLDVGIEIPEDSKTGSSNTTPPEDNSKKRRLRPKWVHLTSTRLKVWRKTQISKQLSCNCRKKMNQDKKSVLIIHCYSLTKIMHLSYHSIHSFLFHVKNVSSPFDHLQQCFWKSNTCYFFRYRMNTSGRKQGVNVRVGAMVRQQLMQTMVVCF